MLSVCVIPDELHNPRLHTNRDSPPRRVTPGCGSPCGLSSDGPQAEGYARKSMQRESGRFAQQDRERRSAKVIADLRNEKKPTPYRFFLIATTDCPEAHLSRPSSPTSGSRPTVNHSLRRWRGLYWQ